MLAGAVRLIPFLVTSVAIHAIVLAAGRWEALEINAAPAGNHHEVSIRLEAAAPAPAKTRTTAHSRETPEMQPRVGPSHERPVEQNPAKPDTAHSEPPETVSQPSPQVRLERRQASRESSKSPRSPAAAEPYASSTGPPAEPVPEPVSAQPAERTVSTGDRTSAEARANSEARRSEAREAIVTELAKYFRYPRIARKRGWEGTVVLSVRILPDGRLDDIKVKRSSGRALLDWNAAASLAHVKRLPEFADRLREEGLALEIPVTYRLESA